MERNEFNKWFIEQVKTRWPNWKLGCHDLDDWFAAFGKYDVDLLSRAVQRHRMQDASSQPNTKKLSGIVRSLAPIRRYKPAELSAANPQPANAFWQKVRTTYPKHQRIELITTLAKFYPDAREKDPQAYNWAIEKGLIKGNANKH